MKVINVLHYYLRRIFGKPNEYHIVANATEALRYSKLGKELKIVHQDTFPARKKAALWKLTKEYIISGTCADAIEFIDSKTEYVGNYAISYFQPCKLTHLISFI